jgi:hypothetical protein
MSFLAEVALMEVGACGPQGPSGDFNSCLGIAVAVVCAIRLVCVPPQVPCAQMPMWALQVTGFLSLALVKVVSVSGEA